MRLSNILLIAVTLIVSGDALSTSTADMTTLSKTASTGVNNGARLLRRGLKTVQTGNDEDSQDEERGNNFFNAIDDVFNPKTLEQLRLRAIKQDDDDFYNKLINQITERATRFQGWKTDNVSYAQVRGFMEFHKRSEAEIVAMLAKYKHFIRTGIVE